MSSKYRNPPVVEALCEVFFEGSEWDDTVVGQFYDRVKGRFPQRRQVELQKAQFTIGKGHSAAGIHRMPSQMQFLTEEGSSLLQIRQDLLVVNQLRPYTAFEAWEPTIFWALDIYQALARPKSVKKIGLRYINQIIVPSPSIRMEEYFKVYPQIPPELGAAHGSFLLQTQIPCERAGHGLFLTLATSPAANPNENAHLLDLYAIFGAEMPVTAESIQPEVQAAHANIIWAFEGSITDALRKLFGRVDN